MDRNPYAPPFAAIDVASVGPDPSTGGSIDWEPKLVIKDAYRRFKTEKFTLVTVDLIVVAATITASLAPRMFGVPVLSEEWSASTLGAWFASSVAVIVLVTYLRVGAIRVWLDLVRERPISLGQLFAGSDRFPGLLVVNLVLGIVGFIPSALLQQPGMSAFMPMAALPLTAIIGLVTWSVQFFMVDARLGAVAALSAGWDILWHDASKLIGLFFYLGLLLVGGALACGIGYFVALPCASVSLALVYSAEAQRLRTEGAMRGSGPARW